MLKVPNRHAAVFDPVQQSKQWETRILAEEKVLGLAKQVAEAKPGRKLSFCPLLYADPGSPPVAVGVLLA